MVPHTNELSGKFGEAGLTVIGVTGEADEEGREKTVQWVQDKGVEYGYAYDVNMALFGALGLEFFPSAVLIDPFGNVVYQGHPSGLTEDAIEGALEHTLPMPLAQWPEAMAPVGDALRAGHFGPAKRALAGLEASELTEQLGGYLDKVVEYRIAGVAHMVDRMDVRGALAALDGHAEAYAGYDEALAKLTELAKALETDRAKEVLTAQGRIAELEDLLMSGSPDGEMPDFKGIYREFQEIAEGFEGTAAGDAAGKWVENLRDFVESLEEEGAGAR